MLPITRHALATINGNSIAQGGNIETVPSTAQVLTATAGATHNAVGSYAYLRVTSISRSVSFGTNYAGSDLRTTGTLNLTANYSNIPQGAGVAVSGTWKALGTVTSSTYAGMTRCSVFLRIA